MVIIIILFFSCVDNILMVYFSFNNPGKHHYNTMLGLNSILIGLPLSCNLAWESNKSFMILFFYWIAYFFVSDTLLLIYKYKTGKMTKENSNFFIMPLIMVFSFILLPQYKYLFIIGTASYSIVSLTEIFIKPLNKLK